MTRRQYQRWLAEERIATRARHLATYRAVEVERGSRERCVSLETAVALVADRMGVTSAAVMYRYCQVCEAAERVLRLRGTSY